MKKEFRGHANKGGVYKITNIKNGKIYIGSAKRFRERASGHTSSLRKNKHQNKHLQASWNKHGKDAFLFEVLEVVRGDKLARTTREEFYIQKEIQSDNWENCYNFQKKPTCKPVKNKTSHVPWNKGKKGLLKHDKISKELISEASVECWSNEEWRQKTVKAIKKAAQKRAKTYLFISPSGKQVQIKNLKEFCRTQHPELDDRLLNEVNQEKRISHKGWTKANPKKSLEDWKIKRLEGCRRRWSKPEEIERNRKTTKELWNDSDYRRKQIKSRAWRTKPILQLDDEKSIIVRWDSTREAASHFRVSKAAIKRALWQPDRKSVGFYWRYE